MRRFHLTLVLAAVLAVAVAYSVNAGGRSSAGSGPYTPPGFSSPGGHNGFVPYTTTTTSTNNGVTTTTTSSENLPGGWDQGKADWKGTSYGTRPPGLGR